MNVLPFSKHPTNALTWQKGDETFDQGLEFLQEFPFC